MTHCSDDGDGLDEEQRALVRGWYGYGRWEALDEALDACIDGSIDDAVTTTALLRAHAILERHR